MESVLDVRTVFKQLDLFAGLDDELLDAVAALSVVRASESGERLIRQAAEADGAWATLDGEARFLRNSADVAEYAAGRVEQ